jgi:hypothetical protein
MRIRETLRSVLRARRFPSAQTLPRKTTPRLQLESLEERTVPTIVFNPVFSPETVTDHGGTKLNNPPVYLIFWGSYWQTPAGVQMCADLQNQTASLLSGPYLSGLQQYGVDGHAHLSTVRFDKSDPSNGFTEDQVKAVFNNQIDNNGLPEADDTSNCPIYVVLTPPNVSAQGGALGYHGTDTDYDFPFDFDRMPYAWVGGFGPDYASQVSLYMDTMSHEVVEAITDSEIDLIQKPGITSNQPGYNDPNSNEIADFEPEATTIGYAYRVNGVETQAYWSKQNQAFIVPNGTYQNFTLNPLWNGGSFTNTFTLTVNSGQESWNPNDIITVDSTSAGGVLVTMNGETVQFDPGQITAITINAGPGSETINVEHTLKGVPVTINLVGGSDTVNLSPSEHFLPNLQGSVIVNGQSRSSTLTALDQNDGSSPTWTVTGSSVSTTLPNAAAVQYTSLSNVNLYGGSGAVTYNVLGTTPGTSTYLNAGAGNDTINVLGTTGALTIDGNNGTDLVSVGALSSSTSGSLANVTGKVQVSNSSGQTTLIVKDSSDTTPQTGTVTNTSVTWGSATVGYAKGVTSLDVYGGSGGNVFNILSTAAGTGLFLDSGIGNDTVNVQGSSSAVSINGDSGIDLVIVGSKAPSLGGSLTNVTGTVQVSHTGSSGHTTLGIDDSGDTRAQVGAITANGFTLGGASVNYTPGQVSSLAVHGGSGGNLFNVKSTSAATSVSLDSGLGNDTVNVQGNAGALTINGDSGTDLVTIGSKAPSLGGSLANVTGHVNVSNSSGHTTLVVDDSGDTAAQAVPITSSGINVGTAGIGFISAQLSSLQVYLGSGNDTVTLVTPAPTIPVMVNGGAGSNTVMGANTVSSWVVNTINGGTLGVLNFASFQNLVGGTNVDTFQLLPTGSLSGSIKGGGAPAGLGDWLDYSSRTTPVVINLSTGTATSVAGGVSGIQNVFGGNGGATLTGNALGNILVGGTGADLLIGGTGRSLLIGGKGNDTVQGSTADDILISGFTSFDANETALMAILAEWQRPIPFDQRVSDLTSGISAGAVVKLVAGTTVFDDGGINVLSGGGGSNWIFKGVHDHVS